MTLTLQPKAGSDIPYGVHFSMPEDEYHAIPALSSTGMKHLRASPLDFWARSPFNPRLAEVQEEEGTTEFRELGKAFDKRIIEGQGAFTACYAEKLEASDYPECLRTLDDLKAECRKLALAVSGNKDALIDRLIEYDAAYHSTIWDRMIAAHEGKHDGKTFFSAKWIAKIEIAAAMIEKDPYLSKAFSGGAPQVSIIWRCPVIGVDCKARLDYLKAKAIVDLKTLTNVQGRPVHEAVNREIANRRYHVQAAFYQEAVAQVAGFIKEGLSDSCSPEYDAFIKSLAANHPKTWLWVFQIKGVAPVAIGRTLPTEGMLMQAAKAEIEAHKQTYRLYTEKFGTDPWVSPTAIEPLSDEDIPPWAYA